MKKPTSLFIGLSYLAVSFSLFNCKSPDKDTKEESVVALSEIALAARKKEINADKKIAALEPLINAKVQQGFNGAIAVMQRDVVLYQKAFGYANFTDSASLTNTSKFQLASLSKTFTAVAVMQLVEKGKLDLTNDVRDFYPNFPYKGITIHSLLCHRSGLPSYEYSMNDEVRAKKWYPTNQEMMQWFATKQPPPQPYYLPDHRFSYNNTNFAVLAAIVEKISGQSFDLYLQQHIFLPLQMHETFAVTSTSPAIQMQRTTGHQQRNAIQKDFYDNITGDKGIYSTTGDLLKWYKALRDGSVLSKESLREAFTPRSFEYPGLRNYGYGFRLWLDPQQRTDYVYHTGWWKGYNTIMFFDLREDFVIILLANRLNQTVYHLKDIINVMHDGKRPQSSIEDNILDS